MQQRPFWFLINLYGWVVLGMSIITAIVIRQWWIVLLGLIGYLLALLLDLVGGRSLGRTGAIRLAQAEQENRELRAEQARLLGTIQERDTQLAAMQAALGSGGDAGVSTDATAGTGLGKPSES